MHKHAALALANLSMYSDTECQLKMINKKVQDWLFLLASMQDGITRSHPPLPFPSLPLHICISIRARYYACFAICTLVANKEIESTVIRSGTLSLVEPFLLANKPEHFAISDYRHSQGPHLSSLRSTGTERGDAGRPKEWLEGLVPMLRAKVREARSLAAYHFAMEAGIKRQQDNITIFQVSKHSHAHALSGDDAKRPSYPQFETGRPTRANVCCSKLPKHVNGAF